MRNLRFSLLQVRRVSVEIPRRAGRNDEGEAGRVRRAEITALPLYVNRPGRNRMAESGEECLLRQSVIGPMKRRRFF